MQYRRVYLDANILIDIYDDTRTSHELSYKALSHLAVNPYIELYTSCDIVTTIYYVLSSKSKKSSCSKNKALDAIFDINELCDVVGFSNKEILESCDLMKSSGNNFNDLEDTIQYVLAQKTKCDLILSNDKKFVSPDIQLLSGKAFVEEV